MKVYFITVLTLIAVSASHAFALSSLQGEGEARLDSNIIAGASSSANLCLYEIVVKTAPGIEGAGTDARVYLKLSSADESDAMEFPDLESWGWMGPGHDYFESGNMDIFGHAPRECMAAMPCKMLLVSDGSSGKPDWYVNFVEIIQIDTDLSVVVRKFFINGWLSVNKPPYQLFAYQDLCGNDDTAVA
ncbi:lipoxygenase homology domain-containing protein 1-like [Panicum miliaceum]|uniref:Lipoxygenase homology domain-containing protein 1-like n=1 Tax=Panicum miliaceum TaxID=4540 RepID=A0A3L6PPS6_PANMI|nr:lipoxygenase homology domain-containing protein 1-like [Panicum miliaceum]